MPPNRTRPTGLMPALSFGIAAFIAPAPITAAPAPDDALVLWFDKPAANWFDALPGGNGRMGVMVFGGTAMEHLQLNEDTIWSGGPYEPARASAREAIQRVRELVFKGTPEAQSQACSLLYQNALGQPMKETSYQVLGDLALAFPSNAVSGITEMLLQSRAAESHGSSSEYEVDLLPALPKAWPNGSVKGLRARGGFEVDVSWKDGSLAGARIQPLKNWAKTLTVRHGGRTLDIPLKTQAEIRLNTELQRTPKPL